MTDIIAMILFAKELANVGGIVNWSFLLYVVSVVHFSFWLVSQPKCEGMH